MGVSAPVFYRKPGEIKEAVEGSIQKFFADETASMFGQPHVEVKKDRIMTPEAPEARPYMRLTAF